MILKYQKVLKLKKKITYFLFYNTKQLGLAYRAVI